MAIKVLVVDDDDDQLSVMELVLSSAGFNVYTARSAPAALHKLKTTAVDVILCDYMMPQLNGAQMEKQLLDGLPSIRKRHIPFLLITANNSLITVTNSLPGIDGIFDKSHLKTVVVERIRRLALLHSLTR